VNHLEELTARAQVRSGVDRLPAHLEATYGVQVSGLSELDRGVFRVDRGDGPSWVARLFPAARPVERVCEDGAILAALEELELPAERCAANQPVSVLEGQGLLVTEHVPSVPRGERRAAIIQAGGLRAVGDLLGRLSSLAHARAPFARAGGSWHHLADGPPAAEIEAAAAMLGDVGRLVPAGQRALYDELFEELRTVDGGDGLPESFIHADLVLANIIASQEGGLVVVDWAGAGQGPRVWALAFLLWSVGFGGDPRRVQRVVAGYRRHVRLEADELSRLGEIIRARPVIFDAWMFCLGRKTLEDAVRDARESRQRSREIADWARVAFAR
jgi:Ser/Thr protein kinase RdoA (MazF antagonist)